MVTPAPYHLYLILWLPLLPSSLFLTSPILLFLFCSSCLSFFIPKRIFPHLPQSTHHHQTLHRGAESPWPEQPASLSSRLCFQSALSLSLTPGRFRPEQMQTGVESWSALSCVCWPALDLLTGRSGSTALRKLSSWYQHGACKPMLAVGPKQIWLMLQSRINVRTVLKEMISVGKFLSMSTFMCTPVLW